MSRKDYEQMASVIKREVNQANHDAEVMVLERLAKHLAGVFALDNPRFDRVRFMRACGFLWNHFEAD